MKYSFKKYEAIVNAVESSFLNRTSAENWVLMRIKKLSESWFANSSTEEVVADFLEVLEEEKKIVREFGVGEPGSVLTSLIV